MGPDDIALGSKPVRVRRQKKSSAVVRLRLNSAEIDALFALAEHRNESASQLLRQIVQDYLAKPEEAAASVPHPYFPHDSNTIGYPVRVTWGSYN